MTLYLGYRVVSTPPENPSAYRASWRDHAACLNHPKMPAGTWDDTIEGEGPGNPAARQARIHRAISVCRTCPVSRECMDDVDLRYDEGVRGGVDLREVRAGLREAAS